MDTFLLWLSFILFVVGVVLALTGLFVLHTGAGIFGVGFVLAAAGLIVRDLI